MNYSLWFAEFFIAAVLLFVVFYFSDSTTPWLPLLAAAGFVFFVIRLVVRSWKGFFAKSKASVTTDRQE